MPRAPAILPLASGLLVAAFACAPEETTSSTPPTPIPAERSATHRALAFVLDHLDTDGALPSRHYGVLRAGLATAAMAAWRIASASAPTRAEFARELTALHARLARSARAQRGATRSREADSPPVPGDYPNYEAAYHLLALSRGEHPSELRGLRIAQLRRHQFGPTNGWTEADSAFGGWGLGVEVPTKPFGTDFVNLATTAVALEALRAAGVPTSDPMFAAARVFVGRCAVPSGPDGPDRPDRGASFYAPVGVAWPSKAGSVGGETGDGHPIGYAAPTAMALRAWIAVGASSDDPRVVAGWGFLRRRFASEEPLRVPLDFELAFPLEAALRYSTVAGVAEAARALGRPVRIAGLGAAQRLDGSWANPDPRMKEDDPLIATLLALGAIGDSEVPVESGTRSPARERTESGGSRSERPR